MEYKNTTDINDIKNNDVYISLGYNIIGNYDDGYSIESSVEDLKDFVLNILNQLDYNEKEYIISKIKK